ncbi:hypothetical protein XENTR_v10020933 [Xenopus tropicalis]|nr:hypothetical protein XENTR_v10020933 [Xenopus tropicalis]
MKSKMALYWPIMFFILLLFSFDLILGSIIIVKNDTEESDYVAAENLTTASSRSFIDDDFSRSLIKNEETDSSRSSLSKQLNLPINSYEWPLSILRGCILVKLNVSSYNTATAVIFYNV